MTRGRWEWRSPRYADQRTLAGGRFRPEDRARIAALCEVPSLHESSDFGTFSMFGNASSILDAYVKFREQGFGTGVRTQT